MGTHAKSARRAAQEMEFRLTGDGGLDGADNKCGVLRAAILGSYRHEYESALASWIMDVTLTNGGRADGNAWERYG